MRSAVVLGLLAAALVSMPAAAFAINGNDDQAFSIITLIFTSEHVLLALAIIFVGVLIRISVGMTKGTKFDPSMALSSFIIAYAVGTPMVANAVAHIAPDATPEAALGVLLSQLVFVFGTDWAAKKVGISNKLASAINRGAAP